MVACGRWFRPSTLHWSQRRGGTSADTDGPMHWLGFLLVQAVHAFLSAYGCYRVASDSVTVYRRTAAMVKAYGAEHEVASR